MNRKSEINLLFEECELWPIYLSLFDTSVLTLWGCAKDKKDMFLSSNNDIIVFKDEKSLISFIKRNDECNFLGKKGYLELRKAVRKNLWDFDYKNEVLDYRETGILLNKFNVDNWKAWQCSMIVDCLNSIVDAAYTIKDKKILSFYKQDTIISDFLDELTFYDPSIENSVLKLPENFDRKKLYSLYTEFLGRIVIRMVFYV